jgi:hypothetical protein
MHQEIAMSPSPQGTPSDPRQSGPRFTAIIEDLTLTKESYVKKNLDWYKSNATRPMLFYRASGVLLISLSVSVPVLATRQDFWMSTVLPVVSVIIAGLTALNTFFQWQSQWQKFRQSQFMLEYLLSCWNLEIVKARHEGDEDKAIEIAVAATAKLMQQTREITANETDEFFRGLRLPDEGNRGERQATN